MAQRRIHWLGIGLVVLSTLGCYADADYDYVEYPGDVRPYPHYVYDGRDVYYVHGRWYHQRDGRWAAYRREPPPLYRHRAYEHDHPDHGPPPRAYEHEHLHTRPPVR